MRDFYGNRINDDRFTGSNDGDGGEFEIAEPATVKDVTVQLSGTDGNAFAIIGKVSGAMKRAGFRSEATEFVTKAMAAESYDALLQLCMATVDVE